MDRCSLLFVCECVFEILIVALVSLCMCAIKAMTLSFYLMLA